mgnify:CR=1 FL=1
METTSSSTTPATSGAGLNIGPAPLVGMGATILFWTDRKAATIVAVSADGKRVSVQEDRATRTDKNGMSEAQAYAYEPNLEATILVFTLRKNGRYIQQGAAMTSGLCLGIGFRDAYHDYSF